MRATFPRMDRLAAFVLMLVFGGLASSAFAKKPSRPPTPPAEPPACDVPQPNYALFIDAYPDNGFHLVVLPCMADAQPGLAAVQELRLDLPRKERRRFQVANGDVYVDGETRRIVFGGRPSANAYWAIYEGVIDVARATITDIRVVVSTAFVREEDPRYSPDGQWIVYKRDGEIWKSYAGGGFYEEPVPAVIEEGCELWAPSMYANAIAYARRCAADPNSDRIVYHPDFGAREILPSEGSGPDRFAHFTRTGELVYSHVDTATGVSSLWIRYPGADPALLHDETISDDDIYAERGGDEYIAFSGWNTDSYDLYIYRRSQGSAVKITSGINVLGSVLFD